MDEYITEDAIINMLRARVSERKGSGGAASVAAELGFSGAYICDVLARRRYVSDELAKCFGYRARRMFIATEPIRDASDSAGEQ